MQRTKDSSHKIPAHNPSKTDTAYKTNSSNLQETSVSKRIALELLLLAAGLLPALLVAVVGVSHILVILTQNFSDLFFSVLVPTLMLLFATLVPVTKNPIHALLFLLGLFGVTALLYLKQHAEYLALVFLIVYVGALAILFLFVIMLLNVKNLMAPASFVWTRARQVSATFGAVLFLQLYQTLSNGLEFAFYRSTTIQHRAPTISEELRAHVDTDVLSLRVLYEGLSPLFFLITMILVLSMIGAIVLATADQAEQQNETDSSSSETRTGPNAGCVQDQNQVQDRVLSERKLDPGRSRSHHSSALDLLPLENATTSL